MFCLIDVNKTPRLPHHSQPLYETEAERETQRHTARQTVQLFYWIWIEKSWSWISDSSVLWRSGFTAHMMPASMSSAGWREGRGRAGGGDKPRLFSNPSHHQSSFFQANSDAITITEMFTSVQFSSPINYGIRLKQSLRDRGVSVVIRGELRRGGRGASGGGVGAVLLFPGGMVLNVMIEHRQGQGWSSLCECSNSLNTSNAFLYEK